MKVLASSMEQPGLCLFDKGWTGLYKGLFIGGKTYKWDDVRKVSLLDEEQYKNWAAKAGWGIGLGLATGGVGLIAGALISGNNKDRIVKFDLAEDMWIVAVVKRKDFRLCPQNIQNAMRGLDL